MIVSINWLKQYVKIDRPIEELATIIGARLVEIEEIIDLGKKYQGIVVAKIVSVDKHPNADKLHICKIDDGGKTKGVKRDSDGLVQVVCGAPNVRKGLLVAWLPPKSTVPASFDDDEPFILGARELRGVVSNGMLASAKELAIGDSHEGILEVDVNAKPGDDFALAYELNDYLLDIENKSLTHRPDCFGIIGLAREIAAITNQQFKTPNWLLETKTTIKRNPSASAPLKVNIKNTELSSRYQAVVLNSDSEKTISPILVQSWLARTGIKPISPIVDVTNYLMALTGQPLHAFDYDKFTSLNSGKAEIVVRAGKKGEKLKLLDTREIILTPQDIVIASGDTPVALAGAMGGLSTAIDGSTKNILLESASFNLYNLRSTQMRHGIFTDAITRFTKGQSPEQTAPVLSQAVDMLYNLVDAEVTSPVVEQYPGKQKPVVVETKTSIINQILGADYTNSLITSTLKHAEFDVTGSGDQLKITTPYWRADIHIAEDIAEEIGRINGYDEITTGLPVRPFVATSPTDLEELKQNIRSILVRSGANDILSYSFVHGDLLQSVGQKTSDSFAITNAISPKLQYYRQTLTPSLLELVHPNIKAGYGEFSLFEINKTHNKVHSKDSDGLPDELEMTALVYANKKSSKSSAFYNVRSQLDFLATQLGLVFEYSTIDKKPNYPVTAPFDYSRSAYITEKNSGVFIGIIGEYRQTVIKNLKLPNTVAGCELGTEDILKAVNLTKGTSYRSISKYPGTSQDITLQVTQQTSFAQVWNVLFDDALKDVELEWSLRPIGVYQPDDAKTKNMTFRIQLTDHDKTITREQANEVITLVTSTAAKKLDARIV
ncbi:MAG: phenylalanine--tRNA ligase subunit beta [Candidatus Saccharibacteria bacterium]|nr:phenylalanine--tRNA ligase subunit beta [Candidatus Saccharibacteria bacterium]